MDINTLIAALERGDYETLIVQFQIREGDSDAMTAMRDGLLAYAGNNQPKLAQLAEFERRLAAISQAKAYLSRAGYRPDDVPSLVKALRDAAVSQDAVRLLQRAAVHHPAEVCRKLVGALQHSNSRESAADLLTEFATTHPREVSQPLIGALADPQASASAMTLLRDLGATHPGEVIRPLIGALADPARRDSAAALLQLLADQSPSNRQLIVDTMRAWQPPPERDVLDRLIQPEYAANGRKLMGASIGISDDERV